VLNQDVAIKVEKKDKNKNILIFEFQVLNNLKGRFGPFLANIL